MKVTLLSITSDAEKLIEQAGRTAYLSFNKLKEGSEQNFIKTIIKRGHLSVLEHASATFRIQGCSRVMTHQLVRHRLCSYTQQSQRYVNESNFGYVIPDSIKGNEEACVIFVDFMQKAKELYTYLQTIGIKNEDARFVLPNAAESEIVITANFRQWRHIIEIRSGDKVQCEIRDVVKEVLKVLKEQAPNVFGDLI